MKVSETEIARCVIDYLESIGWDIYQEVSVYSGGRVADIVGIMNNRTWVVETKTSFNLSVIEQANDWKRTSNYVSVAIPFGKRRGGRSFAEFVCRKFGIGVIYVEKGYDGFSIRSIDDPELRRFNDGSGRKFFLRDNRTLRDALCVEQKTFALAGNANGKYWTPFKATCKRVFEYIKNNQGCNLKDIVSSIDHHYANDRSAYGSLIHWIAEGKVDGLIIDTTKKPYRHYTLDYKHIQLVNFRLMIYEDELEDELEDENGSWV